MIGAIISGIVVAGASAAMASAMQPEYPAAPDYAASSREVAEAEARLLPTRRALEQAARMGTKVTVNTVRQTPIYKPVTRQKIDPRTGAPMWDYKWDPKGGNDSRTPVMETVSEIVGYTPETRVVDFTGMGDAEVEAKIADEMAAFELELSREFAPEFIAAAKRQLELADPEGVAARGKLAGLVMEEEEPTDRPVAAELERQLREEQGDGEDFSEARRARMEARLRERGDIEDTDAPWLVDDLEAEGGEARRAGANQRALAFSTSGVSDQDFDYRKQQQELANLASFRRGETPVAQFGQLSGAQQGASPTVRGPALPTVGQNFGGGGAQSAAGYHAALAGQRAGEADSWMAGLGLVLKGAGGIIAAKKS